MEGGLQQLLDDSLYAEIFVRTKWERSKWSPSKIGQVGAHPGVACRSSCSRYVMTHDLVACHEELLEYHSYGRGLLAGDSGILIEITESHKCRN